MSTATAKRKAVRLEQKLGDYRGAKTMNGQISFPFKVSEYRNVVGYEDSYIVTDTGNVYSLPRKIYNGKGYYEYKGKKMKQVLNHKGYPCVYLSKNGKDKYMSVHRLVAMAFIPNPNNLPQVNHKNGNKIDNRVGNLEWCTNSENQLHAWNLGLQKVSGKAGRPKKKVLQIDQKTGNVVAEYNSISEAAKSVGVKTASNIGACCRNGYGRKTIKGYMRKFKGKEGVIK